MKVRVVFWTLIIVVFSQNLFAQISPVPWKPEQMLAPASLVSVIKNYNSIKPLIINIGPSGLIKDAVNIGSVREAANAESLKKLLAKEKTHKEIIVYCGCCPYKNCPNIRPAFNILSTMKFTNFKLLDLPQNLKVDWIDRGYPMSN